MKARLFITFLSLTLIMGCSYDSIDDPLIEGVPSEVKSSDEAKMVTPIQFEEYGTFKVEPSKECPNLKMHYLNGNFSSSILGEVKTQTLLCTDKDKQNSLNGVMWLKRGYKIFYESELTEEDSKGLYYIYKITGGTGIYENITGKFKVHFEMAYENNIKGSYRHFAEGMFLNMKQP